MKSSVLAGKILNQGIFWDAELLADPDAADLFAADQLISCISPDVENGC